MAKTKTRSTLDTLEDRLDPAVLGDLIDRITPQQAQSVVGTLSVALGAVAAVAPARTGTFFGLRDTAGAVPLLVRMVGVRNAVAGLRTLQASNDDDRTRALQAGLALGAVDAAAVLLAARSGAMSKRSALVALAVLGAIAWLGVVASD